MNLIREEAEAVTDFLPADPAFSDLRFNFWCTSANQIHFIEELEILRFSDAKYSDKIAVPFSQRHLWILWNEWNHNSFPSFTTKRIVQKVDDEWFTGGLLLVALRNQFETLSFLRKSWRAAAKRWRTV